MRPTAKTGFLLTFVLLATLALNSCSDPEIPSLYEPDAVYRAQPLIESISPAGSAIAGIDTLVIKGSGYSTVLAENSVYFNVLPAAILFATSTQLTVKAPLVIGDSVGVRIAVVGSLLFSNTAKYELKAGVAAFGGLGAGELSTALCTDATGNLFVGYSSGGVEAGLLKFAPSGTRSNYAPATAGVAWWTSLKMGPGGYIYAARNFRALYRFSPRGGSSAALWLALPIGAVISDFDFDQEGNLWGGGNGTNLYRIAPDKAVTVFPFIGNVRSLRVYGGSLYFAAKTGEEEKIWRAPISLSGMGTPEVYFDFGASYPTKVPLGLTFSSDGFMLIGTNAPEGIVVLTPAKSPGVPFGAYSASFGTGVSFFAWGSGEDLYASTANGVLLRFGMRGKTSAPYYGSTR